MNILFFSVPMQLFIFYIVVTELLDSIKQLEAQEQNDDT